MRSEFMVSARDIDSFYLQNASDSRKISQFDFQGIPEIEAWISLEKNGRTLISGRVVNYPNRPQGVQINTSSVEGYFSENGRVFIKTKNSVYELGRPRNEVDLIFSVPDMNDPAKITIWN